MSDNFYRAFEERYRGSRELIKSRQRVYLSFIEPLLSFHQETQAIDLGCGRGEWLELLKESGFEGRGVDLDDSMLAACREHGLNAAREDAISALKALPNESQIIVSGFHIAEHIQFSDLQLLVKEALRVLKPAGLLILETPNPENITVGTVNFYLDPTHQRPIPPPLLAFLPEYYGFARVKVIRLQEDKSLVEKACTSLRDVLGGVSPDYAVVAQKTADTPILDGTRDAFEREYGLTLDVLLERFDQQSQQASDRAAQAEVKAQQASDRAAQAEVKAQQANSSFAAIHSSSQLFAARIQMVNRKIKSLKENFLLSVARISKNPLIGFFFLGRSFINWQNESPPNVDRQLHTIAVDLTPILPGGENGGAKIFVLELLSKLAEIVPQTNFVLLTQAASHEELSMLDRSNMRRRMVVDLVAANSPRSLLKSLALIVLPHLPNRMSRLISRAGYKLNTLMKRKGSGSMLREMSVDLLFCPFTAPTYFEPGIPTVCTVYDLQYKTYPEFFSASDVTHRDLTFMEACRRATALTAISNYSRDTAIAHGKLDPNQIRTIYLRMAHRNLPDAEHNKTILSRLGLFQQQYLIYPANFWSHKNHEMLLTAFGIACNGRLPENIQLVCTGASGTRQEKLMLAVRNMNLGNRVLFPGYLSNAELAALIANSSGVIFPSLYEGFGLPVIEAMAAGVPIGCSNNTSLPEVAGDAAILFDPRIPTQIVQAMVSMVKNEALRSQSIKAGQKRAVEFMDVERMAREYWELFQYAVSNEKKYENMLVGVYEDGWIGSRLNLQLAPAKSEQTIEIEFSAPEWLPQQSCTIQAFQGGKPKDKPLFISRGSTAVLSVSIEKRGGECEVRIESTFVPALTGHGLDQRELSVLLQRCSILFGNADRIELFTKKLTA